jgi:hypothetical protein
VRTTRSVVTFLHPFVLDRNTGELPAGDYEIETDEDEIIASDRTAYRRTAVYFYVNGAGSTRMLTIAPAELDSALERDLERGGQSAAAEVKR